MLDFFGYENYGKEVLQAIEKVLVEAKSLTPDLGGTASTSEVGDAVVSKL
jgi:tartrate dehydrogenase/decarboxylase/D-malate dehydrogenase